MKTHEKILSVCKEIGLEMEENRLGTRYSCERFLLEVLNHGYWLLRDGDFANGYLYGTGFKNNYTDEWLVRRIRELALEEKLEML